MKAQPQSQILWQSNGRHSLLQAACEKNCYDAVVALVELGADINFTISELAPIRIAAKNNNYRILEILLQERLSLETLSSPSGNVLLDLFALHNENDPEDTQKCFQLILDNINCACFDINAQDAHGNTILHYAAGQPGMGQKILQLGGSLFIKNKDNNTPLRILEPNTFEEFLNSKILLGEGHELKSIVFDYRFLGIGSDTQIEEYLDCSGTVPLKAIDGIPELRPYLVHPVLQSFIFLKWQKISACFYLNLFLYILFCVLLSIYVVFGSKGCLFTKCNVTVFNTTSFGESEENVYSFPILRSMIALLLLFIFIRETLQMAIDLRTYFLNYENWLELGIIAISTSIIALGCPHTLLGMLGNICRQLNAFAMLLSWTEVLVMIGKLPQFSVQTEMLKAVSLSYVRFLRVYILLVVGYALSFYVLFRGIPTEDIHNNPFPNVLISFFKSLVMLVGEFDAGSIPFLAMLGTSHIIFVTFIFVIVIVLMNLLNGLAVADTKAIIDDAHLLASRASLKLLVSMEEFRKMFPCLFSKKILNIQWPCNVCYLGKRKYAARYFPKHQDEELEYHYGIVFLDRTVYRSARETIMSMKLQQQDEKYIGLSKDQSKNKARILSIPMNSTEDSWDLKERRRRFSVNDDQTLVSKKEEETEDTETTSSVTESLRCIQQRMTTVEKSIQRIEKMLQDINLRQN